MGAMSAQLFLLQRLRARLLPRNHYRCHYNHLHQCICLWSPFIRLLLLLLLLLLLMLLLLLLMCPGIMVLTKLVARESKFRKRRGAHYDSWVFIKV